jgi:hypothetical protein
VFVVAVSEESSDIEDDCSHGGEVGVESIGLSDERACSSERTKSRRPSPADDHMLGDQIPMAPPMTMQRI